MGKLKKKLSSEPVTNGSGSGAHRTHSGASGLRCPSQRTERPPEGPARPRRWPAVCLGRPPSIKGTHEGLTGKEGLQPWLGKRPQAHLCYDLLMPDGCHVMDNDCCCWSSTPPWGATWWGVTYLFTANPLPSSPSTWIPTDFQDFFLAFRNASI